MDIGGQKRSDNFEDRGAGAIRGGGGGGITQLFGLVASRFGIKGMLVFGVLIGGIWCFAPDGIKRALLGTSTGPTVTEGKVCDNSKDYAQACDFSRAVLASTETVWSDLFAKGQLPTYGKRPPSDYPEPTLVVFSGGVSTGGCGNATSAVGPFYCPADQNLYIDPGFYETLARKLDAPGDFAQAYVIAHEVGHHIQNLIGSLRVSKRGETKNQASVRAELQADCFAGVWGHFAKSNLKITDEDLDEATQAAHSIGDDALGHSDEASYTHGTSAQRIKWFKRGFDSGDPRQCDTYAVDNYNAL